MAASVAALVALLAVLATAQPAAAHGVLVRSDPQDGGMVVEGRTRLMLWFAEAVDLRGSTFLLHTADGDPVDVTASISADGDGVVELETTALGRGIYVLDWRTLSIADGHTTDGSLLFGAGVRPDVAPAAASTWPGWDALLSRWLALSGLLVAVGAVAVTGRVLEAARLPAAGAVRRALLLGAAACGVAVLGAVGEALQRTPRAAEGTTSWLAAVVANVVGTRWGQLWCWHAAALVLAAGLLAAAARGRSPLPPSRAAAAGALLVAATTEVLAGHVAGSGGLLAETVAVLASSAHLLAAGTWLGSLVVLAVCLLPVALRTPGRRRLLLHGAWRAFSPLAAASSLVVLASGLLLLGRDLPDLAALRDTSWGLAATGKVAALVAVLGVAAFSTLAVHPRSEVWLARAPHRLQALPAASRSRFPRLVGLELACLGAAVLLAAVMTSVATAQQQREVEATPTARSATVDGLFLSFEQVPLSSRESRVVLRINPLVRPQPGPVTGSDVMLVGPGGTATTVTLAEVEEGHWEATAPTPGAGRWTSWIAVERRGAPDAVAPVSWTAAGDPDAGPFATPALAVALALLAVGAAAALVVRRRRPTASVLARQGSRTVQSGRHEVSR
ncbi:copper resistance CopC/CopD family protein [Nocardioides taihuensis]|uniref:Copper resistance CopC/CopD family protein n=1 Tax=Nocardioides taihuensis TaxID=1835606 RepID=A0ABW0BIV3_9ACTN